MTQNPESYWNILDPSWDDLCTGLDDAGVWPSVQSRHPSSVVHLFCAHFCQSEVRNGGWLQFFWNSTGVIGPEAVVAFEQLGMPNAASVAQQAVAKLGEPYPRVREQRWNALLAASSMSGSDMRAVFETEKNFFIAFRKTTLSLELDALSSQFWHLLDRENGGFQTSADRYASSPHHLN